MLPTSLLTRIAKEVLTRTEAEMVDTSNRCAQCQQSWHFRCECAMERAGFWPDSYALLESDRCMLGTPAPVFKTEDAEAYRTKLLGAVQSIRQVSKYWRDTIGYELIDMLRLEVDTTDRGYSKTHPLRREHNANPLKLPTDFSWRFSGVVDLDLSGTLLETLPVRNISLFCAV